MINHKNTRVNSANNAMFQSLLPSGKEFCCSHGGDVFWSFPCSASSTFSCTSLSRLWL